MRSYTRKTAGKALSKKDFFLLFNSCLEKSMTVENAQAAFRTTGLFPVNIKAIPQCAYDPSKLTDMTPTTSSPPVNASDAVLDLPDACPLEQSNTAPSSPQQDSTDQNSGNIVCTGASIDEHRGKYRLDLLEQYLKLIYPLLLHINTLHI